VRNKYVGYVRVSTKRQGKDGLGADSQKNIINQYVSTRDGQLLQTFAEEESGKKINRPELEKAIALAKKENATLVIAKLDRLARNVYFTAKLMKSNVEFVCCDMPGANKMTIYILAAVAEQERETISARTKAALEQKRRRGESLGSKNILQIGNEVKKKNADERAKNILPIIEELKSVGLTSLAQIADGLNKRGVPTARGRKWYPSSVNNVIGRRYGT
jgi:DNA invertase Pin-like site-specific DNA recombinase